MYLIKVTGNLLGTFGMHQVIFWNYTMHNDVYEPVAYTTGMTGTAAVKLEAPQLPRVQEFMMKHGLSNYGLLLLNNNPLTINNCVEVWHTVEPLQTSPNRSGHLTWSQLKLY